MVFFRGPRLAYSSPPIVNLQFHRLPLDSRATLFLSTLRRSPVDETAKACFNRKEGTMKNISDVEIPFAGVIMTQILP